MKSVWITSAIGDIKHLLKFSNYLSLFGLLLQNSSTRQYSLSIRITEMK